MKKLTALLLSILITAPFMANAISLDSLNSAIQDKKQELTQAQLDEYLLTLEGMEVNWHGNVSDVKVIKRTDISKEKRYTLHLVGTVPYGSHGTTLDLSPLRVRLSDIDKETALSLNKNQEYNFFGRLRYVSRETDRLKGSYIESWIFNITVFK